MIVSHRGICTGPKEKALQLFKTAENDYTPTCWINSKFYLLLHVVKIAIYFDIGLSLNIHVWKIFGK